MSRLVSFPTWRRFWIIAAAAITLPLSTLQTPADAQALKQNTALQIVPEDAAFFVAGLRYGEIFEKVMNSNAMAKLREIPAVQLGWALAAAQWENPEIPQIGMVRQMLQTPDNQQLLALLRDAVSHEVFVYGDSGVGDLLELINELNAASNAAQMEALAAGDFEEMEEIQARRIMEVLNQKGNQLKVPTLVTGMKLTATEPAVAQLARLEVLATQLAAQAPPLQGRFSRETIGAAEFLTIRLDGTMVPWPLLTQGMNAPQMQPLFDRLAALKLVISLGVRGDYLIVSVGEDNQHLATLGQGPLLHDRAELAPVRAAADKPLVAINYISAPLASQIGSIDNQLDQLAALAQQFIPLSPVPFELHDELIADIDAAVEYIKSQTPQPGAMSGFAFLTADGNIESFTHNWSTDTPWDASQPLTILAHLGGDPIAFWAGRGKSDPEQIDALATALRRGAYYFEQMVMQAADESQQAAFEQLRPLIEQLGSVTREKLVPAFDDGQSAFVLDAKSTSDSWILLMPPSEDELPMLEVALVMGVSDARLVKEAFAEYFRITQQILDKLHELSTGDLSGSLPEIPAVELARPQSRETNGGAVYYYAIPAEAGLDPQIAPNAGLSDQIMAMSLLPRYTARLLADSPLQGPGPLTNLQRPLASAGHLDFTRLVEAIEPWIDYGLQLSMDMGAEMDPAGGMFGNIPQQIHDVLDVIKCFRGVSSVTYQEENGIVTHALWRFEDLP
jgi:hypothetical protein